MTFPSCALKVTAPKWLKNDLASQQSVLKSTCWVFLCWLYADSFGRSGSTLLSRESSFCFLALLYPLRTHAHVCTHTVTHTHRHTPTYTRGAAVPDHMRICNTTGCCRVDVWGAKFRTNRVKQYLLLGTNYLSLMCLINPSIPTPLIQISVYCEWSAASIYIYNMSQFSWLMSGCVETIRKQKDKQKDSRYLPCCGAFAAEQEIRQIAAVSPELHC